MEFTPSQSQTTFEQTPPPLGLSISPTADFQEVSNLYTDVKTDLNHRGVGHFLKDRNVDDLCRLHDAGHMILSAKYEAVTVGAVIMAKAEAACLQSVRGYPLDLLFNQRAGVTVIQGMVVHPSYGGRGVAKSIVQSVIGCSQSFDRHNILAKVADDNIGSYKLFEKSGFQPEALGKDWLYGHRVSYLCYNAKNYT